MRRLALLSGLLASASSLACSCVHSSLEERLLDADVVAVVRIESVAVDSDYAAAIERGQDPYDEGLQPLSARFRVVETLRGELHETQRLVTGFGGGDCGVTLTPGHDVLVAEPAPDPGADALGVGYCSASRPLGPRWLAAALGRPTAETEALIESVRRLLSRGEPLHRCLSLRDGPPPDPSRDIAAEVAECNAWFDSFVPASGD